jgi:N-methylhydantoinase A
LSYEIGLDVGGTFTDCVAIDDTGQVVLEKAPTTPDDQSIGVLDGLERLATALGFADVSALLRRTTRIVHGTTTADNAMIQMRGAATGLLVTEGFRDEIEMRRCYKEDIWDPTLPPPEPIARRRVRLEVRERITAEGQIDTPLDESHLRAQVRRLRSFGVTSIAVVFLHSFRNPVHEIRARVLIEEEFPDVELVSLSHEVLPKPPEFERTSTTLVNAFVGPPIVNYLNRLLDELERLGYRGDLLIATCGGGVATQQSITRRAVATINSGPTGGVVAAANAATTAGLRDVVSVDMGGTSFDVCLIRDGRPELKSDWNWRHRYCIALPMIDIHAIGAGGGSIAHIAHGTLAVGPNSAGARPGPASYGRGGVDPTVTDANLVLGRIHASDFWGGRLALDEAAADRALRRLRLDDPLGVATDIIRLVEAHMADAIRRVLALAGVDPRALDLVAFGGMGGLHSVALAQMLGMRRVLVPALASGFSAAGLLQADHVIDRTRSAIAPWQQLDLSELDRLGGELDAEVNAELDAANVPASHRRYEWFVNLVYPGQTFDTSIAIESHRTSDRRTEITAAHLAAAVREFHRRNEEARLIETRAQEPMVRGLRLRGTGAIGRQPAPPSTHAAPTSAPTSATFREVWFPTGWEATRIVATDSLGVGDQVVGPAILQSPFTSTVVDPAGSALVLPNRDLLITISDQTMTSSLDVARAASASVTAGARGRVRR